MLVISGAEISIGKLGEVVEVARLSRRNGERTEPHPRPFHHRPQLAYPEEHYGKTITIEHNGASAGTRLPGRSGLDNIVEPLSGITVRLLIEVIDEVLQDPVHRREVERLSTPPSVLPSSTVNLIGRRRSQVQVDKLRDARKEPRVRDDGGEEGRKTREEDEEKQ